MAGGDVQDVEEIAQGIEHSKKTGDVVDAAAQSLAIVYEA